MPSQVLQATKRKQSIIREHLMFLSQNPRSLCLECVFETISMRPLSGLCKWSPLMLRSSVGRLQELRAALLRLYPDQSGPDRDPSPSLLISDSCRSVHPVEYPALRTAIRSVQCSSTLVCLYHGPNPINPLLILAPTRVGRKFLQEAALYLVIGTTSRKHCYQIVGAPD